MAVKNREIFHRVWEGFLTSLGMTDQDNFQLIGDLPVKRALGDTDSKTRSMSMSRLREQLWYALDNVDGEWAYPIDIFVGDSGSDLFSIVAQAGKLYQVPLTVSQETVTLGEWTQVKEEFTPTTQSRFSIRRQKDGKYRWLCVAGTTVLNRVGEIDSSELFDSFVRQAEKRGKYPRLDYYHMGETNPKMWEFGTADYLARDGVCYIASGLFDEDHPLAQQFIKESVEDQDGKWGNSIEFYAYSEPEIIVADPEVRIPVYKEGENIRISVVLEEDAAGLFTRCIVNQEVRRTMDANTKEQLKKLYGDDEEGMQAFIDSFETDVDTTNQRVKNDKLIHRAKTDAPVVEEVVEDEEEETQEEELSEILITDELVGVIAQQITQTDAFRTLSDSIQKLTEAVAGQITAREIDTKEIARLATANKKLATVVDRLSKDDGEKKTEYLQDLPARKQTSVGYRPRDVHNEGTEEEDDYAQRAAKTLAGIKNTY